MLPKIKTILVWSTLMALLCAFAYHLYKRRNKFRQEALLHAIYKTIISDQSSILLKRYLAPGHSLDWSFQFRNAEELYPFMNLKNNDDSKVNVNDMTASEILICACFNNFPQDVSLDAAPSPSSKHESHSTVEAKITSSLYTPGEYTALICHRLSYLELFHTLIKRYSLYLEIEYDGRGGFEIKNKALPTTTGWELQQNKHEELQATIEIMNYCKRAICSDSRMKGEEDIRKNCADINKYIEELNKFTLAVHDGIDQDMRGLFYHSPTYLSKMEVDDALLQQLRDGALKEPQPTIKSTTCRPYDTDDQLREFGVGQRHITMKEENSLVYNHRDKDRPESEIGSASAGAIDGGRRR